MNRSNRSIPVLLGTAALTLAAGCCHCPQPAIPPPAPVPVTSLPPQPPPTPPPVAEPAPKPEPATNVIKVKDAGLQTPECVVWDQDQDIYLVSNINGDPTVLDKNGFISKIGPDGKVIELKWIDGTKKGVDLSAPKGMAIVGNILYVADVNVVRKFDKKSGKPKGVIPIKGAVFLNAFAVAPDGKTLYVSDSAVKIEEGNFSGTDEDAIYAINVKKKSVKPLVKDRTLHWPNGILADEGGLWSVSLGKNELIQVSYEGALGSVTKLPAGSLDGIVRLGDGSLLISSWQASAIFRGIPGGEFTEVIASVPSPAAIGLDTKRDALLIPIFTGNAVEIHTLPKFPPLAPPAKPAAAPTSASPAAPGTVEPPAPPPPPGKKPAHGTKAAAPAKPAAAPVPPPAPAPAAAPAPAPAPAKPAAAPAPAPSPAKNGHSPARWQ
jgi:hypothetical protein